MKQLKSHDFPEVYKWLGINLNKLGCVMLDLEPIESGFKNIPIYHAKNEERFWIDGYVGDKPHMTLLYGLLQEAESYKDHINAVLGSWKLPEIEIEEFGHFDSPYLDEPYYCIVGHIKVTPELLEGHQRLQFLPHIDTFARYKPHVTIAYIQKDDVFMANFIADLNKEFVGKKLKIKGINYGGNKR